MQRANTLKIVSRNFTKNCKYQAGKYHCDTTAIKGSTSCKKTKKGVVCVQGSEDHNTVQVKCWKVSGEHVTCSQDRVCAYSQKLNRALCFNKDQVQGDTCVGQGDGKVCYQIDDLSQIKHSVVCQTKDVATCKLIIREFCLRNGKCYSNRSGKAELNKRRDKLCARLVLTQAIAARVLIHCTKHHDDARCRVKSQANLLGRQAEQAIEAKCSVPKNLHQCKVTAMGVSKCRVEVDTCNSLKDPAEKRKCFREIYGECITKLHFTKHFCQGKSMNPVISQSCLAVERGEIKCYVMFQHCKRAQTKEEKASCEKEVELKCAYLSMQYVECFYHKHGGKVEGGQSQKPAVAGDDGMCGVLRSARSYCHQSLMSCNELEGDTRSLCFEDIRMPCTTVIKLYQQGKYNCARSKPEKTETLSRSGRKSGNDAVCKTLLIGTVSCLDQIEKCRRVKDKKGQEYCSKRSESCKGIINRYKQNQKKCFS